MDSYAQQSARVRFWHEGNDQSGFYKWTSVLASMNSHKHVSMILDRLTFCLLTFLIGHIEVRVSEVRRYCHCPVRHTCCHGHRIIRSNGDCRPRQRTSGQSQHSKGHAYPLREARLHYHEHGIVISSRDGRQEAQVIFQGRATPTPFSVQQLPRSVSFRWYRKE